ncbi:hypothetical protein ACFOY8_13295 [Thalassospira xianhensis]|uniref:Uncharacterized protein n=2 Tax=Thalassospira TaxID=168934 RepID=A0A285TTM7_9PROT|nr:MULTISPECIES: hypothetical protein [Thalassospira]RCK07828.1 hypothetical protein TH5_01995 [Thalassospira xianhensis MCCC 1A02616]SOC27119.1 hypothetical protein SAMN05428964_105284 [Thalassospira xiamenensis]
MSMFKGGSGSMVRGGGGRQYDLPSAYNIFVQVKSIHIEDPDKEISNHGKDYVVGLLLNSMPEQGLEAHFDESGMPLTEVKVFMPMPKKEATRRRDVLGLTKVRGGGEPMNEPGSIVAFENAFCPKGAEAGVIHAHFSSGIATPKDQTPYTDQSFGKALVWPNIMTCVVPEPVDVDSETGSRTYRGHQSIYIADMTAASTFSNKEEFEALVTHVIENNPGIGRAGFQLHARALAPEGASEEEALEVGRAISNRMATSFVAFDKAIGEGAERRYEKLTAAEALEKFYEMSSSEEFVKFFGAAGVQFEFVPMMVVSQASSRVPSKSEKGKEAIKQGKEPFCESRVHALYTTEDGHVPKWPTDYGWVMDNVAVGRMNSKSEVWYTTYTSPVQKKSPEVFKLRDLITPNMPSYHAEAARELLVANAEAKKAYFESQNKSEPAPEQEASANGPAM